VRRQKVLLAILVYNGREFVPACLHSAAGARIGHRDVDVVVLDDCSPDQDWSEELQGLCEALDFAYYRSPRNLGIPRNMNLALSLAQAREYDYVLLVNSDVVLPLNLIGSMIRVVETNPKIGSVTAWSNSASAFSLPNADTTGLLRRQDVVDWISVELEAEFGPFALDVPTGVGFCMLLPVPVVADVGLFDPMYGRGYCEEVDWCLRSRALGYRAAVAPSTFVYHLGSASTSGAGMLAAKETTVQEHERIIDLRYPAYRDDLQAFFDAGVLPQLIHRAVLRIVFRAASRLGYDVKSSSVPVGPPGERVQVVAEPDGRSGIIRVQWCGFEMPVTVVGDSVVQTMHDIFGGVPQHVTVSDRGAWADQMTAAWSATVPFEDRYRYPLRV
jgi:GT2 family glycosyltransferase